MLPFLETLAAQMERPREITPQVQNHIIGTYGLNRENLASFLSNELTRLEDYEVDLILSPLFTPSLKDQASVAAVLQSRPIPAPTWPDLVNQLFVRPTRTHLVSDDQTTEVPLREVTITRWVNRLRLDGQIAEPLFEQMLASFPESDHAMLFAIARRAIWESLERRGILQRYLSSALERSEYYLEDAAKLLKLVEGYQTKNLEELSESIPHWQKVIRQEINEAAGAKPFLNERVEDLHGGGRDQRRQNSQRLRELESEHLFLNRLTVILGD